jgi:ATP-dependent DNA ligase
MVQRRRSSGFIAPCLPSKVARPPSGPLWVHEFKHDGYRLMVRRDGTRVRCFTRNGHDWAARFPAIALAALRIKAKSFLIDGEAVVAREDGTPDFHALRSRRGGKEAVLFAFDLIEHDGDDLRDLPLIDRKRRLARLIGRAKRRAIRFSEHLTGDGPTVFEHVCRMVHQIVDHHRVVDAVTFRDQAHQFQAAATTAMNLVPQMGPQSRHFPKTCVLFRHHFEE